MCETYTDCGNDLLQCDKGTCKCNHGVSNTKYTYSSSQFYEYTECNGE